MSILQTDVLSKSYGSVQALRDVSLQVPPGCVFGILGPNGSGKTTLLGTVLQILYPSSGRFLWFGQEPRAEQRRRIGSLLETPNFYPYLTGRQNLEVTASLRGQGRGEIGRVLEEVGLGSYETLRFGQYSLGMKQRLGLGACLLGDPEVIVLDEPTNGLDPAGIADVRKIIQGLHQRSKTIILASHLLDQVEKVCTHVAILKKGRLLEVGSLEQVLREDTQIEVGADDEGRLRQVLEKFAPTLRLTPMEGGFRVQGQGVTAASLNRHCFEQGLTLQLLRSQKRDLESRFLEITDD